MAKTNIPVRHINLSGGSAGYAEAFNIRSLQDLTVNTDLNESLHRHDFYYLLVVEHGSGSHEIDLTTYPVVDHSVFFLRPGQIHQLTLKKDSSGYLLQFTADFLSTEHAALLRRLSHKTFCPIQEAPFSRLRQPLETILEESSRQEENYLQVMQAQLLIFLIALARQRRHPETPVTAADAYTQQRLDELLVLIDHHLTAHKQVSEYADLLHLSVYQLNAITKTTLGKTCSQVINEAIILEAKRYLLATCYQINQIAWHLGYEDPSYFIRFFKKHTGLSPESFRNQHLS